jgi:hypothetical protein
LQLRELHSERFSSIALQFEERDKRTEQLSVADKTAIAAALQAQKEAAGAQNESNTAAVAKIETNFDNKLQSAWRPKAVYSYIQSNFLEPDFVVDITEYMDKKLEAISAFKSQFFNPEMDEPNTFISDKSFLDMIKSQNLIFGKSIGVQYAEGFHTARYMGVDNLFDLI